MDKLVNVYHVLSEEECNIALIYNRTKEKCQIIVGVVNTSERFSDPAIVDKYYSRVIGAMKGNFPGADIQGINSKYRDYGIGIPECLNDISGTVSGRVKSIVWPAVRQLLDMTDAFMKKMDKQNSISRQDNLILAEKLSRLQQEKEKCESDRFANVDKFMAGQLDKDVYQRRRADLGRLAEKLEADIAELEQKLKAAEIVKDDSLSHVLGVMKKYSGAEELTQAMVQELIEKVVVTDPEHVEIVWKFKDEARRFIGI